MTRSRRTPPDPTLLFRAVKWARLPGHGHTIAEACKRFGITVSVYRRARRELGESTSSYADEDLILSALHSGEPVRVDAMIGYYEWINRAGITRSQVLAILERLERRGMVRRLDRERFRLVVEWP